MNIRTHWLKFVGLVCVPLALAGAKASDELIVDLPSPFGVACIKEERIGANWRHGLHRMRETWDKYFQVYPDDLEGFEATTLQKVKENPSFVLDRNIQFDVYFARTGSFYRPFVSPFHEDGFVNFSVWPYGVDLWQKDIRGDISPLFYIDKLATKMIEKVSHLPMYTPIHVWAIVRSKSDNMPWVEVKGFEIIQETALSEPVLRHMEAGASQLRQKRYDLAVQLFEQAIDLQMPVWAELHAYPLLARAYYEQRLFRHARNATVNAILRDQQVVANLVFLSRDDLRVDPEDGSFASEAKEAAERAIVIEPTNPEAHAELGLALAMLGDIRAGYTEVDYAQKLAPRGQLPEANRNRAMIALLEKNLELAKQELNQAVILRATDYTLHLELGDVHLAMGHLDDARREFTQAKELAPLRAEPFYKTALAIKLIGEALEKDGKKDEALKAYADALENVKNAIIKDVHMTKAYGLEAELLHKLGRDEEAKKVIEQGASLNSNNPRMNDVYYQVAAAINDWAGMEKSTRASLVYRRDSVHYARLGNILANRPNPDFQSASEALQTAVKMDPSNGDDWALLGHIKLTAMGDATGAGNALREAVRIVPSNGAAWFDLAIASRSLSDRAAEVDAAGMAADLLKTSDAQLLQAQSLVDRGNEGDAAKAIEIAQAIETGTKIEAQKARAQSIRAAALVRAGKLDEAQEAADAADSVLKNDAQHTLVHGHIMLARGDITAARDFFTTALSLTESAPQSAVNWGVRADVQRGLVQTQTQVVDKNGVIIVQGAPNNSEMKTTDGQQPTTKRPMPPVTEEGNGSTEPVPAQVPGPR